MPRPTAPQVSGPLTWCLSLAISMSLASAASAQCPESSVSCVGQGGAGEVVFNVSETSDARNNMVSYGQSVASYNLADGTIHVVAQVEEAYRHTSGAIAVDRFVLHGTPAAWVTIRLNLVLNIVSDPAFRTAWIAASARLAARDQTSASETNWWGWAPVSVSTYMIEGDALEITYEAAAEGWGYYPSCTIDCQIEFLDLPEGATITSCNGFTTSPVAAQKTTWGAVKALYR